MTDQELKDMVASLVIDQRESKRSMEELKKLVGGISQSNGELAEQYFTSALEDSLQVGDLKFDEIYINLRQKKKNGLHGQFDAALVNGETSMLVEIKYKLREQDVIDVRDRKLTVFRELNDFTVGKKVYVALAGMVVEERALALARELGYFVLTQENKEFKVLNAEVRAY